MIDSLAYNNKLRWTDPSLKFGLAMAVVLLCLLSTRPFVGLIATAAMWLWVVALAQIPPRIFAKLLFAEGVFLFLSLAGILLSVGLSEPLALPWRTAVGPLWFASSPAQIDQAILIFCRTMGAMGALNSLTLTTPLIDLITLWQRWRVPELLIDLMIIMYRFIFVLLDTLNQMAIAQACRLGRAGSYSRRMNNAALLGSRLFINAFQRSQQLETALRSRGYDGALRVLPLQYKTGQSVKVWAIVLIFCVGTALAIDQIGGGYGIYI